MKTKKEILECFSRLEMSLAKGYVYRLLAFKGFMTGELKAKLHERKVSNTVISHVLKECERLGCLDDKRELKLFIEEAKRKVWGPWMLEKKLKQKLKSSGIEVAISREDQMKEIERWVEKKYKGLDFTDLKVKQKIFRFLKGKGFDERLIREQLFAIG